MAWFDCVCTETRSTRLGCSVQHGSPLWSSRTCLRNQEIWIRRAGVHTKLLATSALSWQQQASHTSWCSGPLLSSSVDNFYRRGSKRSSCYFSSADKAFAVCLSQPTGGAHVELLNKKSTAQLSPHRSLYVLLVAKPSSCAQDVLSLGVTSSMARSIRISWTTSICILVFSWFSLTYKSQPSKGSRMAASWNAPRRVEPHFHIVCRLMRRRALPAAVCFFRKSCVECQLDRKLEANAKRACSTQTSFLLHTDSFECHGCSLRLVLPTPRLKNT